MTLTIGSLFAGIGGLELGLEWAGLGPTLWQVEQSEYCRAVLAKHWPDAQRFADVREVGAHNLPRVDVLCGGFPCQDISDAGQRRGIRGERSGLWFEYARLIRELRPRYVVVENVAALLNRGLGDVLGALAAIGYDAEWDCIPAAAIGAPHRRDRLFLVAYSAGVLRDGRRDHGRCDREGARTISKPGNRGRAPDMAHAERGGLQGGIFGRPESAAVVAAACRRESGRDDRERGAWHAEPNVGRLAHGLPRRLVERSLTAIGNAVVPQVAEVVGRLILAREQSLQERAA